MKLLKRSLLGKINSMDHHSLLARMEELLTRVKHPVPAMELHALLELDGISSADVALATNLGMEEGRLSLDYNFNLSLHDGLGEQIHGSL